MYRHRQIGTTLLVLDAIAVVVLLLAMAAGAPKALWALVIVLVLMGVLFGALTVEVDDRALTFRFGAGGWGKRIPLADITSAAVSPVRWYEGIGMHFTTRGLLYNVALGKSVDLTLRSGRRYRVGSDEAEALLAALGARGVPVAPSDGVSGP